MILRDSGRTIASSERITENVAHRQSPERRDSSIFEHERKHENSSEIWESSDYNAESLVFISYIRINFDSSY